MAKVLRAPLEPVVLGPADPELVGVVWVAEPVVPKPVLEVGKGLVERGTPVALPLPLPLPDEVLLANVDDEELMVLPLMVVDCVADTGPMEKGALVANTVLMSEISTNVMV